ncbi:MAG: hypothetical protein K8I30_19330, partial [Anaerolineae bacterium]|nr:hypothetical protein [Anaerolineae bacterium]
MNLHEAVQHVETALTKPVDVWPGYGFARIPFVIYDADEAVFFNHPNPRRPPQLTGAATALDIEGIQTATIPAAMVKSEADLIPLLYHEGFHVYQNNGGFAAQTAAFDFFRALAFYPELHGEYRALCLAEAEVYNTPHRESRPALLGALAQRKQNVLTTLPNADVLAFERNLERVEGTASFVEAAAREKIYGLSPDKVEARYGWSRQYTVGQAVCRFLRNVQPSTWQQAVAAGNSPTDIVIAAYFREKTDLSALDLETKIAQETEDAARISAQHESRIAEMLDSG